MHRFAHALDHLDEGVSLDLLVHLSEDANVQLRPGELKTLTSMEESSGLSSLTESKVVSGSAVVSPEAAASRTAASVSLVNDESSLVLVGNLTNLADQGVAHLLSGLPVDGLDHNGSDVSIDSGAHTLEGLRLSVTRGRVVKAGPSH